MGGTGRKLQSYEAWKRASLIEPEAKAISLHHRRLYPCRGNTSPSDAVSLVPEARNKQIAGAHVMTGDRVLVVFKANECRIGAIKAIRPDVLQADNANSFIGIVFGLEA